MPFADGENVGAYRIVEKLGQGGMATVFKAYHPALDRYVAIKVMHPAFAGDANFLGRFQREARIVARLDHPHIIPIYDYAEHRGHPYLVMRFVEGETLKARMERSAPQIPEVLRIAQAVGEALVYAHGQGVLHRDIKPSNIMLTADGGVYLTDFGLARMAESGESTLSRDMMLGTPQYISPEQAKGVRDLDARTDVYSLGVVLYELLVGRPPFIADTPYAVIHDHIFTPLPLPSELNPDLPEPVQRLLLKALAKEPDDRFQTVTELIAALEATLTPAPGRPPLETVTVEAPPPAPAPAEPVITRVTPPPVAPVGRAQVTEEPAEKEKKPKRRWPWLAAGAAALLCIAVAAVGLLLMSRGDGDVPEPGGSAEELLQEARIARDEEDLEQALDLYTAAAAADPHLIPAYLEASEVLVRMDDTDGAIDVLLEGTQNNTEDTELHARLASIALLTRRFDVAEKESRWLMQQAPAESFTHAYTGLLAIAQDNDCSAAYPELESALLINSDNPWAHYGLGLCLLLENKPEEARPEFKFVLENRASPAFLANRARDMLVRIDEGGGAVPEPKDAIRQEYDAVEALAADIADNGLRTKFKDMLSQARQTWEQGDEAEALQLLKETHRWIKENKKDIGDPPAAELDRRIDQLIRLAEGGKAPLPSP